MGLVRLDKVAEDTPLNVDRRPYLLQPDRPPEGAPRPIREGETEVELSAAWQERARESGVIMRRPKWAPNTLLAHEATVYAKEVGRDGEFHHATARAYWESGTDLGDLAELKGLAEKAGLDWSVLGPRLESGYYRPGVLEQYQEARAIGVSGTPTYQVEGGAPTFGNLSIDDLRKLIQAARGY